MRVHENFLLVLSVFGIGLVQRGHTGCINNTMSCYLGQYFIPALHPGLNSALCLELPNLEPSTPQMIAVFSDCESFVDGNSYSDGYSCQYASPSRNSNNCTRNSVIVECIDEHKTLPTGRAVLAINMMTTDISAAQDCTAFLDVSWTQTACVVEEFYEYPNPCSGIVNVITISGTNTTLFAVNVSGIESIGNAVLLNASSYFCGKETMNGSTGDIILCEAELHNRSRSVLGTGTDDYLALFRCPGDATLVPEGPAKIVFERNLTLNLTAECQMLTPSTPYTSDYSAFQIEWRHPDSTTLRPPVSSCEEVTTSNLDHCTAVCVSLVNSSTDIIETCEKVVENILDGDDLTGDEFSRLLDILSAFVVTPGVEYLEASLEIIQYLIDGLHDNVHVITDTSGRRLIGLLDGVLADEKQREWMLLQKEDDAASNLLGSVEAIGSLLGRSSAIDAGAFHYVGESILALTVERVQLEDTLAGSYRFPKDSNTSAMVEIPVQLLCDQSEDHTDGSRATDLDCPSVISSAMIRNLPGYLDQGINRTGFQTNTVILATQVQNASNLEDLINTHPVQLHFAPTDTVFNFTNTSMCVFWNFTISDWSSSGLATAVESSHSVVCTSKHLTSFAVLVEINGPQGNEEEQFALKIVSYIGCSISLLCLTLTVFIFSVFGKRLNKGVLLHIHLNFAIALALALLLFISGLETARNIEWLCTLVAALLHYLLMCVFCWMLAEGIMLYLLVVKVFGRAAEKWYYLLILGWGLPIPVVGISVGIRHQDYGTNDFCWLSTRSGTIWAFVGPMLFIILINSIILILTIVSLVRGRKVGGAEPDVRTTQLVKTVVKSTVILLPLLGITWLFGLLAVNENTTVFAWVFTVCNSLQGFFFFVFHVLRNEKVCEVLSKCFMCLVPVIGVDRQEIIKDMSNMGTADSMDGAETNGNNQDLEIITTQYRIHTFERSYSGTSQDSTTAFVGALNTI